MHRPVTYWVNSLLIAEIAWCLLMKTLIYQCQDLKLYPIAVWVASVDFEGTYFC